MEKPEIWCQLQGAIIQFFQIGSFGWVLCIALSLYLTIVKNRTFNLDITWFFKFFHIGVWAFAALDVGLAFYLKAFGNANTGETLSWCWIKAGADAVKMELYFAPFLLVLVFNIAIYLRVSRTIVKVVKNPALRGRATHRMLLYMLVFIFCIGTGAINRIQSWATGRPLFWLHVCDAIASPSQGFLNCLVYGMNKQLRTKWKDVLSCRGRNYSSSSGRLEANPGDDYRFGGKDPLIRSVNVDSNEED
eukprot:TRINITY_DN6956_c0_g1_i2.p1 TRINITY_DN6956_c0_g1~~TRINITY_DN6956_c0_g1_i2.p1  ORF type:complete len:247 (+),score=23.38 TRINITY_DN6956_c0_g1_i2:261-1001(+)